MKTMHGEACFACSKRSRTREAPTPTNISTKSEPEMEKNGTPASPATAPREQRLTGTRRPVEQHTLRDARAERLELLRVLEELLDLLQLLDRLLDAGDVLEADLRRVGRHPLRARLPEGHHLRAAALHLVHQEDPEAEQQDERQQRGEDRPPGRTAGALRVERHLVLQPSASGGRPPTGRWDSGPSPSSCR